MREKLIELLRSDMNVLKAAGISATATLRLADNLIANGVTFAEDNNVPSKWIPVTERLPENDQWALCFMKDKSFGTFRVFQWNYIDWQWNDVNEWFDEKDVTHWMPLPSTEGLE